MRAQRISQMVAGAILLGPVCAAESSAHASFTNRQGQIFLNVTVVRTNRDTIVFKKEGQLGFFTEKLTNLPERVQWDFRAREREQAAEREKLLGRAIEMVTKLRAESAEKAEAVLGTLSTNSPPQDFGELIQICGEEQTEIKAILDARANDTPAEKLAALREVHERFRRIDQKAEQLQNGARDRLEKTRREETEIQERRGEEELIKLAKIAVESRLLAPTTAKFSDLSVSGGIVYGTVTAQNLFGASLSRRFEVHGNQIDRDGSPQSHAVHFSLQEFAKETERIWN
jgi:DNA-directed RNA polymerase subunit F